MNIDQVLGYVEQSIRTVLTSIETGGIDIPTVRQLDVGTLKRALEKIEEHDRESKNIIAVLRYGEEAEVSDQEQRRRYEHDLNGRW